jgi:hypothetical protein
VGRRPRRSAPAHQRVHDEGAHAAGDCALDLRTRLGDAVEHDLPRIEPHAERLFELSAGVHLDVDAGVADHMQEPQVGAGLAGVEHLSRRMAGGEGAGELGDVGPQAALAVEEERRGVHVGELRQVDAGEDEVVAADDEIRVAELHRRTPGCAVGCDPSILPSLRPTGHGSHVNRLVDVKPHDHRRAAFSGGKFHDF